MPFFGSSQPAGNLTGMVNGQLNEANQQGFFSPGGSDRYRAQMRRRLLMQGRNRRNRSAILSRLAGLDQMGQQNAMVNNEQDIAGTTADALNNFDTADYGQNRDYFRGLYGNQLNRQQDRQDYQRQQHDQFLGGLGSLAGQGALAYMTGGTSLAMPKAKVRRAPDPGAGGAY